MSIDKRKWVVSSKGRPTNTVEISAVQYGAHGNTSWGWPGVDKIILLDQRSGYSPDLPNAMELIKDAEELAQVVCDHKNKKLGLL
ncbi:hypothetical protein OBP_098 [Pseudomonas phage OBP]|uniref:hypothetical protein n=1 Tax=Pseudomonas phage OBP TaxID=1124849 RepID=UPI000240D440|nr:hypothetical protein OBP_098 [Pseudomonas phage OBP]AEV89535.1 hypothetical protein OBP_098 [Pseudomonas phage OBP]